MLGFQLAHPARGHLPRVVERPLAGGAAGSAGALMLVDGSGNFAECAADPTAIAGASISAFGADTTGFNRFGKKEFPPGRLQVVTPVDAIFHSPYVGTLPGADGGLYGVIRDTDTVWKVDFAETVNTRLKLVQRRTASPENVPRVLTAFLVANIQQI